MSRQIVQQISSSVGGQILNHEMFMTEKGRYIVLEDLVTTDIVPFIEWAIQGEVYVVIVKEDGNEGNDLKRNLEQEGFSNIIYIEDMNYINADVF